MFCKAWTLSTSYVDEDINHVRAVGKSMVHLTQLTFGFKNTAKIELKLLKPGQKLGTVKVLLIGKNQLKTMVDL